MLIGVNPSPRCLHPDELDLLVLQKGIENADGVAPASDAGDYIVGKAPHLVHDLLPGFLADYHLEVTHH